VDAEERLRAKHEAADRSAEVEAEGGEEQDESETTVAGSRKGDVGLIGTGLLLERDR
jgi:hypothetical protein